MVADASNIDKENPNKIKKSYFIYYNGKDDNVKSIHILTTLRSILTKLISLM